MVRNWQCVNPADQLQINDEVLYLPEGVETRVIGYTWTLPQPLVGLVQGSMAIESEPPRIVGYELACGITARREHLKRHEELSYEEMLASGEEPR